MKVGDFGLSLRYVPDEEVAEPVGSLIYASPEVLRRKPYVGPELDVWALGILRKLSFSQNTHDWRLLDRTVYEMLCGTPPFVGENERELCHAILSGAYTIPEHVSPGARSLISRMIKVKKYRY